LHFFLLLRWTRVRQSIKLLSDCLRACFYETKYTLVIDITNEGRKRRRRREKKRQVIDEIEKEKNESDFVVAKEKADDTVH